MTEQSAPVLLSVSDASRGNQRQADALAEALAEHLQMAWSHYRLSPRLPWRWLAPRWGWGAASGFDPGYSERLEALRPVLVVGCGRQAALATRIAKRCVKARTVQILDPRMLSADWDLRVLPSHDGPRDPHTVITRGSLHPINLRWLQAQRAAHPEFGARPAPRQLILLGGPTRQCRYGPHEARQWIASLPPQSEGRWVVGSRRTPLWLREQFQALPAELHWWGEEDGSNPYGPALAWADQIWLSPDSVNMISEAAATLADLQLFPAARLQGRLAAFHQQLIDSGRLRGGGAAAASVRTSPAPWCDLEQVVEQVIERLFPARAAAGRPRT